MTPLARGRYRARLARDAADLARAQALRGLAFHGSQSLSDHDDFDRLCDHLLVEETASGALVCCFRVMTFSSGRDIDSSYSAQFYGLTGLRAFEGSAVELGRFCIHPDHHDPDILRLAWGALTVYVDAREAELLFGCASFPGTDATAYYDSFALLKARYLAPKRWLPRVKAPDVFRFAARLRRSPDPHKALLRTPPLLRTYLAMGGWVSDHAVVDRQMNTLHVFTGVEIASIPPSRQKILRALAG